MNIKLTTKEKKVWKDVRELVLLRDNKTCQVCRRTNIKPRALSVHHILPREFRDLIFDYKNLITLCSNCHQFSKYAAERNALFFSNWLKINKPNEYNFLMKYLDDNHKLKGGSE